MARYNTVLQTATQSSSATVSTPGAGLFTEFSGTAPYTVTIPDPTIYQGQTQTFYNGTSGVITMTTPNGVFKGPTGSTTSSQTISAGCTIFLASDGSNYVVIGENGGALQATTISASSTVTLSPSSATVTISPSGSGQVIIAPATTGTIDNVTIGGTTAANATINTLTLNTSLAGNGTIQGGTF
jgi:hypothetical protein